MEILEVIEPVIEVLNLVVAVAIVVYGLYVARILKSDLKSTWMYFLVSILLFGVHEVVGSLEEFQIFAVEGLYAFTETLFILAFLFTVYKFHKFFKSVKSGK